MIFAHSVIAAREGSDPPVTINAALLRFVAAMYGVQLDQFATLLADRGIPAGLAPGIVARWRAAGLARTGQLTDGEPWMWATRRGLDACEIQAGRVKPAASILRHTHAVTDVRLALERTSAYRQGRASWRAERLLLAGRFPSRPWHVPDSEVHWPPGSGLPWAGETWAVEVELSRKSVPRIAAIMHSALTRTDDDGAPPASIAGPARPHRYARLEYACSPESVRAVLNARAAVGSPLAARIDVHDLPASALRLDRPRQGQRP